MKRRAFTLLELLITTSIFVVVAVISTSVFTVTARFQSVTKQTQQNTTQAHTAAYTIKDAIERTIQYNQHPFIPNVSEAGNGSFATLARTRLPDGRLSTDPLSQQWEVYCIQNLNGVKRLARFTGPQDAVFSNPASIDCSSKDTIQSYFNKTIQGPEYITSEQVDVQWIILRHSDVTPSFPLPYGTNSVFDIEVATVYDPTNTGAERRASDSFSSVGQVVVHTIANHYDPYNELNNQL